MSNEERKSALFRAIYEALQKLSRDHYLSTGDAQRAIERLERQ